MGRRQAFTWVVAMATLMATLARAAEATVTERPLARLEPTTLEEKVTVYLPSGGQLRYVEEARFDLATNWLRAEHEYKHAWSLDRWLAPGKRWPRQRIAFVRQQGGKSAVVLDGVPGPAFASIDPTSLCFSPDGSRLAYGVSAGEQGGWVVDGKLWPSVGRPDDVVWSPDSRHLGYWGQGGLVIDGRLAPGAADLRWSPRGGHYAYCAWLGRPSPGTDMRALVDGKPGPRFGQVREPVWSPDGRRIAYWARNAGRNYLVVDGRVRPCAGYAGSLLFSPDSRRLAYAVNDGPGRGVYVDGRRLPGFEQCDSLTFSPDSRHLAFTAHQGQRVMLVVDGRVLASYVNAKSWGTSIGSLRWSPDSRRLASVSTGANWQYKLAVNGHQWLAGGWMSTPTFSPDGGHLACAALVGGEVQVMLDHRRVGSFDYPDEVIYDSDVQPVFSPDGRHLAYRRLLEEGSQVVIDGQAGPQYDHIFGWGDQDRRCDYEIDGRTVITQSTGLPGTPGLPPTVRWPLWLSPDRLQYLALRAGTIYLVEQSAPGS